MQRTMCKAGAIVLLTLPLCILGVNCIPLDWPFGADPGNGDAALRGFESESELRSFMASQATARNRSSWGAGGMANIGNTDFFAAPVADATEDSDGLGYSTTNIQEVGVDESDIIKNNGETIYMLTADKIHVVKATPADGMSELTTINIDNNGSSMYLAGNRLVALSGYGFSYAYGWEMFARRANRVAKEGGSSSPGSAGSGSGVSAQAMPMVEGPWRDGGQTTVTIFDVTDPANPVVSKTIRFEGDLTTSRLIGDKLHLVLTTVPKLPDDPSQDNIEAMTADQWLPQYETASPDGTVTGSGAVVGWQNCLRPSAPNGYAMTIVVTLDIANPDAAFETTAVTANVGTVYASTRALYLTDTQYSYDDYSSRTDTVVHKLSFTDAGTDYVASGVVPGRPLSQYSLGEYEDYLRIATTNEQWSMGGEDLRSGLYVLGVNDTKLDVVGKIEDIARGEKIYSARFLGNRGFLVTFRRVDPLFTMDLSDPTNPRIVGELKVPGYSDHIQLLDANHLLTIGRDAEDAGSFAWVQGVLLTIFDITDIANPQILKVNGQDAREVIGGRGTYSEANNNPKAFNYYADRNALAFPVDLYEGDTNGWNYGTHSFTGLLVYRVTVENGFEKLGQISSADGVAANNCFQGYYGSTRGVFIGDNVYSVTEQGVKSASLDDVSTPLGQVTFTGVEEPAFDCFWQSEEPDMALPVGSGLQ